MKNGKMTTATATAPSFIATDVPNKNAASSSNRAVPFSWNFHSATAAPKLIAATKFSTSSDPVTSCTIGVDKNKNTTNAAVAFDTHRRATPNSSSPITASRARFNSRAAYSPPSVYNTP